MCEKYFLMSCLTWLLANFISFPLVQSLEENCNDGQPFLLSYLFVNSLYVSIMSPLHLLNLSVGISKYFSRLTYGRFLHSLNSFVALCIYLVRPCQPIIDQQGQGLSGLIHKEAHPVAPYLCTFSSSSI